MQGRGLDYEGDAVKLNTDKTTFLLVGCDGLWDFMTEAQIISKLLSLADKSPQVMAQEMVKTAQGRPYESYDDVTVIVAKIDCKLFKYLHLFLIFEFHDLTIIFTSFRQLNLTRKVHCVLK